MLEAQVDGKVKVWVQINGGLTDMEIFMKILSQPDNSCIDASNALKSELFLTYGLLTENGVDRNRHKIHVSASKFNS